MLWDGLGALLPPGYRRLPAVAGLHVTVVAPSPIDDDLIAAQPDLLVSRLDRCYLGAGADADGLLLGFAGIGTAELPQAMRALASALMQASPPSHTVVS
jgi:DNA-binding transcriptional MocR family regulator